MSTERTTRDETFLLLVGNEISSAFKRRGLRGTEQLLREAIMRAGLALEELSIKTWDRD